MNCLTVCIVLTHPWHRHSMLSKRGFLKLYMRENSCDVPKSCSSLILLHLIIEHDYQGEGTIKHVGLCFSGLSKVWSVVALMKYCTYCFLLRLCFAEMC